jgi:hypothetical protein
MRISPVKYASINPVGTRPMTYSRSPHLTVGLLLAVGLAVAWTYRQTDGMTTVGAAVLVALFVAMARSYSRATRAVAQPAQIELSDAEWWFRDVVREARMPMPLVLDDYPTELGHRFDLLVTGWCERDGRPITPDAWLECAPVLRGIAGLGCRYVEPHGDEHHGGRCSVEFWGVRFEEWFPPDDTTELPDLPVDPTPACAVRGCQADAEFHAQLTTESHRSVGLCATHLEGYGSRLAWYHELDDLCTTGDECDHYEDDRECSGGDEPQSPQVILDPTPREGSGGWGPPTPGTSQPSPRPKGAEHGTPGGQMWDLLTTELRPFSRSTLASESGLSPGVVSRRLNDWRALGLVEQVGTLWRASQRYPTSGTVSPNGRKEDAGE